MTLIPKVPIDQIKGQHDPLTHRYNPETETERTDILTCTALAYSIQIIEALPERWQEWSDAQDMKVLLRYMAGPANTAHFLAAARAHLAKAEWLPPFDRAAVDRGDTMPEEIRQAMTSGKGTPEHNARIERMVVRMRAEGYGSDGTMPGYRLDAPLRGRTRPFRKK